MYYKKIKCDTMTNKGRLAKLIIVIMVIGLGMIIIVNLPTNIEEKELFPGILGDMILNNNETGKDVITSIISHDDFRGDIIQGYKANYSGSSGMMIIFIAQMADNISAKKSLKDMAIRVGFNESTYDENKTPVINSNITIVKLPVKNPEVFAIQRSMNATLHYTFYKKDKVYWIGLSDPDIQYQMGMIVEVYRNVDKEEGNFGIYDVG